MTASLPDPATTIRLAFTAAKGEHHRHCSTRTTEGCDCYARISSRAHDALSVLEARLADTEQALERISEQQPKTLAMIEANGFVFDDIGREPGNWKHLAFSIYADLCETDTIARAVLAGSPAEEPTP